MLKVGALESDTSLNSALLPWLWRLEQMTVAL